MKRVLRMSWLAVALLAVLGPIAQADVIGPDAFGYRGSNEVPFVWEDISGTGTDLLMSDDDSVYGIANGTFSFSFYGNNYSTFSVGSNGTVYFENVYLGLTNSSIPADSGYGVNRFIAGYWDDLNPGAGGSVLYQFLGTGSNERLVVQWNAVPHFGSADTVTFQTILYQNGDIRLNYLDPSNEAGSGATVGIQENTGLGLQWSFNQNVLTAGETILFSAVPEPSSLSILGLGAGVMGLVFGRRRRVA